MQFHDLFGYRQTQSRALARFLGGEKRVVDLRQLAFRNSDAGIGNLGHNEPLAAPSVVGLTGAFVPFEGTGLDWLERRSQCESASVRHCVDGVREQVDK